MKIELEQIDIEAIAKEVIQEVIKALKPLLKGNGEDDVIFDVPGLAEYLRVSNKWIYKKTHLKEIPYLKINGLLRFRKTQIDKWLSSYNIPAFDTPSRILKAIK